MWIIRWLLGERYKTIDLKLQYRSWWFGRWKIVRLEIGEPDIYWTEEVENELADYLARTGQLPNQEDM